MSPTVNDFVQWLGNMETEENKVMQVTFHLSDLGQSFDKFSFKALHKWLGTLCSSSMSSLFKNDHNFLTGILGTNVDVSEFIKRSAVSADEIAFPKGFQIQSFIDTFLRKAEDVEAVFPSGKVDLLLACLLVQCLPFVRGLLEQEEKFAKAMTLKSFEEELGTHMEKAKGDLASLKALIPSRVSSFSQALATFPKVEKDLIFFNEVLAAEHGDKKPEKYQIALHRCKEVEKVCVRQVVQILKKMCHEIRNESDEACRKVVEYVQKSEKKGPILTKMLKMTQTSRESGDLQDRLKEYSPFAKVLDEDLSDVFYMSANRVMHMKGVLDGCLDKLERAASNPALLKFENFAALQEEVKSIHKGLFSGKFIEIKMVLGDLIVACKCMRLIQL